MQNFPFLGPGYRLSYSSQHCGSSTSFYDSVGIIHVALEMLMPTEAHWNSLNIYFFPKVKAFLNHSLFSLLFHMVLQ